MKVETDVPGWGREEQADQAREWGGGDWWRSQIFKELTETEGVFSWSSPELYVDNNHHNYLKKQEEVIKSE